jgi:hypothetical protein
MDHAALSGTIQISVGVIFSTYMITALGGNIIEGLETIVLIMKFGTL